MDFMLTRTLLRGSKTIWILPLTLGKNLWIGEDTFEDFEKVCPMQNYIGLAELHWY
jgi:hypothetical protein